MQETKNKRRAASRASHARFLDATEELFAERGYDGTKIRDIAAHSGVNLGALHRYWGTKKALFREVCERRLLPINDERNRRFDALEAVTPTGRSVAVRELLRAILDPVLLISARSDAEGELFRKFYGRAMVDPSPVVGEVMTTILEPTSRRFLKLLRPACPQLGDNEFFWRISCVFGTLVYVPAFRERVSKYAANDFACNDFEFGAEQVAEFLTSGMLAPAHQETVKG